MPTALMHRVEDVSPSPPNFNIVPGHMRVTPAGCPTRAAKWTPSHLPIISVTRESCQQSLTCIPRSVQPPCAGRVRQPERGRGRLGLSARRRVRHAASDGRRRERDGPAGPAPLRRRRRRLGATVAALVTQPEPPVPPVRHVRVLVVCPDGEGSRAS